MLKRMRWYLWVLMGVLSVYIGISVYFMEHFFPGTVINGENADFFTVAQASRLVLRQAQSYTLELEEKSGKLSVLDPKEMGVSYYETDAVRKVKRMQNGFLWPRMFWRIDLYQIVAGTRFEEEAFRQAVGELACLDGGQKSQNAWIEMTEDGYQIHPEVCGTQVDAQMLEEQIRSAVSNQLSFLNLEESGCYAPPAVTADSPEIAELSRKLDRWLGAQVTYVFGPESEQVDSKALAGFVTLDGLEASLNPEAVAAWVEELAGKRDTYGQERKFKSTLRGIITVKGGNFGWQIDQETESLALLEHVEAGAVLEKEPAYLHTGNAWSSNYDIGDTYVEVDMGAQRMWVYKDGKAVVDTDVVTGDMRRNRGTPAVVASIQYKARNAVLRGPGYATPVKYWMPFYGGCGIHDASWRRKFGGEIYQTDGSHGCVNTPPEAAKTVFETVDAGTPVILYY